jgi:hypothetical protein
LALIVQALLHLLIQLLAGLDHHHAARTRHHHVPLRKPIPLTVSRECLARRPPGKGSGAGGSAEPSRAEPTPR